MLFVYILGRPRELPPEHATFQTWTAAGHLGMEFLGIPRLGAEFPEVT